MKRIVILMLLCVVGSSLVEARCHRGRGSGAALAGFFGAVTGAAIAASAYSDRCYYREGPPFEFAYAGAPIYVYDYPTYMYAPVYASPEMRYSIYPSYAYRR